MLDNNRDHAILTTGGEALSGLSIVDLGNGPGTVLDLHDTK